MNCFHCHYSNIFSGIMWTLELICSFLHLVLTVCLLLKHDFKPRFLMTSLLFTYFPLPCILWYFPMLKMLILIQDNREKRQVFLVKDMPTCSYEVIVLVGIAWIWEYRDIQTRQSLKEVGFIVVDRKVLLEKIKHSTYFSFYLIVIR